MQFEDIQTPATRAFDQQLAGAAFDEAARFLALSSKRQDAAAERYMRRSVNAPVTLDDPPLRAVLALATRWGATVRFDLSDETAFAWDAEHFGVPTATMELWRREQSGVMELASTDAETRAIICAPVTELDTAGRAARVVAHELIHSTGRALDRPMMAGRPGRIVEEMVAESGAVMLADRLGFDPDRTAAVQYLGVWASRAPEWVRVAAIEMALRMARIAACMLLGDVTEAAARTLTRAVKHEMAERLETLAEAH